MPVSLQRLARNQVIFRGVNERLRGLADAVPDGATEYICECSDVGCAAKIALKLFEYEAVRARPKCFFIVSGHERREVECVVDHFDGYILVEKIVPLDVASRARTSWVEGWSTHDF